MKKRTRYAMLVKAKSDFCKGKTTRSAVKKKAADYVKHAVNKLKGANASAKRKARSKAKTSATRVLNSGCAMTSHIGKRR